MVLAEISKHSRAESTDFYPRAACPPKLSGFASLPKDALEATEKSPEGFSLDRLTLRKTPATIYPSFEKASGRIGFLCPKLS
jgi:hypothetical protein